MNNAEYKRLGDYIREVDVRNRDLTVKLSQGICNAKFFQNPKQVADHPETHKVVRTGQFAYNRATTRNGDKISIAYREGPDCTVSSAYQVFEIIDEEKLLPKYLMMWFLRPEFDRLAIYYSHGSAHEFFEWESMCDVRLPIPPLSRQREIVAEYETLTRRIRLNERLIASLESLAQTLYRRTFVDDIDPAHLPPGWRTGTLGEIGEIVGGATPSTSVPEYWANRGIHWISPADISKQGKVFIERGEKDITKEGYRSASTRIVPAGTVLFSSRAPIGLVAVADCELCTNQGFKSVIPRSDIGTYFTYCLLKERKEDIEAQCSGSIFAEVSGEVMKNYQIIIPKTALIAEFERSMTPVFGLLRVVEREIHILIRMRTFALQKIG